MQWHSPAWSSLSLWLHKQLGKLKRQLGFVCFIKTGFSETCGREFLDMPRLAEVEKSMYTLGWLRVHEGHRTTP